MTTYPVPDGDAPSDIGPDLCTHKNHILVQLDPSTHFLWTKALLLLDAALQAADQIGASGCDVATHIESARVDAKRALRLIRSYNAPTRSTQSHAENAVSRPLGINLQR